MRENLTSGSTGGRWKRGNPAGHPRVPGRCAEKRHHHGLVGTQPAGHLQPRQRSTLHLRRFTRFGLVQGPYESDVLFHGPGLCLRSYAAAVTGRPVADISAASLPIEWFGEVQHTHRAIDDALGYAHLLGELFRRSDTHNRS